MSVAKAAFKVITSYFIMETLLGLDALTPHLGCYLMHINDFLQYGVKIFVITSFKDTCYIEILPNVQRSERGIISRVLIFNY
ncbi:hypothetical protein CK203_025873 [Vitis vinifera]|uniref:Uncharacterized protein n=1 Tax=Vitis vinifera TaxID=29760 RepID=A0A438IKW3_VITVI|nr:hypothetical protein CK203_025873 [Vitis vinifera]